MIDKIIADILGHELSIPDGRIVVNNQGYKPPKDDAPWWVILFAGSKILGNSNDYDPDTDEEIQQTSFYTKLNIEIKGKTRDVITQAYLTAAALNSVYAQQKAEEENIRVFRTVDPVDLSEVDGASSLHRWRIPVTITHMVTKRASTAPFENFQQTEVLLDEN